MPDPNIQATKRTMTDALKADAYFKMGLLPLVPLSVHPQVLYRWSVEHTIAPYLIPGETTHRSYVAAWIPYIWVNAWVVALIYNSNSWAALSNGFSSQQQNKPHMLQLKTQYDKGLTNPKKRLVYMTEFLLSGQVPVPNTNENPFDSPLYSHRRNFHRSLQAAINVAQKELDDATDTYQEPL